MGPKLKFAQRIKLLGRNWFDVTCRDVMQFPSGELYEPWNKGQTWKQTTVNSGGEDFCHCDGPMVFLLKLLSHNVRMENVRVCWHPVSEELYSLSKFLSNGNWMYGINYIVFFSKLISFWKRDKGGCIIYICYSRNGNKLEFVKWNIFFFIKMKEWMDCLIKFHNWKVT